MHAFDDAAATDPDRAGQSLSKPDAYVIAAHPAWTESRVNRPLMQAALGLPRVQVRDPYSSYPDYSIHIKLEQAVLEKASLVVLQHPIQWYSMPALQKLWLDEVLTYGGLMARATALVAT
jgi:glutathione-regulated potassium-efflux system ancillary protein KefF